jgi:hypothetical protein
LENIYKNFVQPHSRRFLQSLQYIARSGGTTMTMCKNVSVLALAAIGLMATGSAGADDREDSLNLKRLSAEFQNNETVGGPAAGITDAAAGPAGTGGTIVYQKDVRVPDDVDVLYITFSAEAHTLNGSALLMNAMVNGRLCQPLAGSFGGGMSHIQSGWYTLLHLPEPLTITGNCNDTGGGTADCLANTIYFSCCARLLETDPVVLPVDIKLANLPGGRLSAYRASTIYVDAQKDEKGQFCAGVGNGPNR